MNIFVGNLSFQATDDDVKELFETFGSVFSVRLTKKSGKNARGFGFVTMPDDLQAQSAIAGLRDKEFMGRLLSVSVERPPAVKPKKDYKEIKRLRSGSTMGAPVVFKAPVILEKKFSKTGQVNAWEKRKGRGTAKPWKKKPGGVNKKFKYAR